MKNYEKKKNEIQKLFDGYYKCKFIIAKKSNKTYIIIKKILLLTEFSMSS